MPRAAEPSASIWCARTLAGDFSKSPSAFAIVPSGSFSPLPRNMKGAEVTLVRMPDKPLVDPWSFLSCKARSFCRNSKHP